MKTHFLSRIIPVILLTTILTTQESKAVDLSNVAIVGAGVNVAGQVAYFRTQTIPACQNVLWFRSLADMGGKAGYATVLASKLAGKPLFFLRYTLSPDTNCYVDQVESGP